MNMYFQLLIYRVVKTDIVQTVLKVIRECVCYVNLHSVEIAVIFTNEKQSHLA